MRILAVDPSLRSAGFAILEQVPGSKARALDYGTIRNPQSRLATAAMVVLHTELSAVIQKHSPESMAVEGVIFVQSYKTAITLGAARGVALLAAAEAGLPIFEYAPKAVKQAVVGRGGAQKEQVAFMVRALLGLTETPAADAADALAIGLAHLQAHAAAGKGMKILQPI